MNAYGLFVVPLSWAFGRWRKAHKTILALGPLRLSVHRNVGPWKGAA